MFRSTLPSPAGEDDQYILSSNADFVFIFRNVYVHEYYTEINCFVTCVQKRSSFLPVAIKFRLVKLQSRNASTSIMNFFPSCCWQANIILLVTSFTSPSDYVLFSPSHVCRQLAILVADFFSSHVLYFARAESSISTKWSANCKETKGLWGSSKRFFRDAGFCLIQRTGFGIRNSKSKRWWELGLKVYTGCGMPNIIIGITWLREIWFGITRLKNPIGSLQTSHNQAKILADWEKMTILGNVK